MDKNKILIIEDEAAIRELLCMNLEAVGYETDTACDGMQAELKIEEDRRCRRCFSCPQRVWG